MKWIINLLKRTFSPLSGPNYLIEFRFHGFARKYLKETIFGLSKKFGVKGVTKKRVVPHVTLFGPFKTKSIKEVVRKIERVGRRYDLVPFTLTGFGHFGNKVVFVDIEPFDELQDLRKELAKFIVNLTQTKGHDFGDKFDFHATIAFKDIHGQFDKIWEYFRDSKQKRISQHLLRITILENGKILYEYDLMQRKLLPRAEAKNKQNWKKTISILKSLLQSDKKWNIPEISETSGKKIFLISDLHLDHANIIKYCNRPFTSTEEMNETIVNNWNKIVNAEDTVYFLGDMAFGRGSRKASYWLTQLKGKTVFIEGNHEETGKVSTYERLILKYKGQEFLLIHDPALKPKNWSGWTIHGHKHNNDLKGYPLINPKWKTVNVSAELVNYTPIELDVLLTKIEYATANKQAMQKL
ncbi:MAG: 2'-5' RNA ligase family protein [Candidatus Diapherotrites archaeon]|nr:2'-5' RNA ligase family protein [Candidatus Diapherotrites archaeon]